MKTDKYSREVKIEEEERMRTIMKSASLHLKRKAKVWSQEILLKFRMLIRPEYAQVVKMLGNGRLEAQGFDGEKRLDHSRGKLRKKV